MGMSNSINGECDQMSCLQEMRNAMVAFHGHGPENLQHLKKNVKNLNQVTGNTSFCTFQYKSNITWHRIQPWQPHESRVKVMFGVNGKIREHPV